MAFNINAHVILQGPKNISAVAKNIQTQLQNINIAIGVNIPKNVQNQINALNKQLNNLNSTNQKVTSGARSAASSIQGIGNQAKQTSNAMQVLGKETALTFKRFAAAGLVTATFFKMTQAIGTAIPKALEFERGLVRLQQITGSTRKGLDKLKNSVNSLAKNFGKDANELLELSQIFAQTGQNLRQVEASVRAVARSSLAPTFGEMKQTAEGLVAALNQFGIAASDSEKVLGSLNRVSKKFAVESDDLIAAIRRAGGVFAISSGQFKEPITALNEFSAIFTAVRSTTRENAETIATGLRTIFSRLQRRGTIDMLQELGINLTDAKGKFIGLFESFRKLSTGLKGLVQEGDAITLSKITEELGGIRQIGKLIPAIKNFNKAEAAFKEAQKGAVEGLGKDVALGITPLIVQFEKVRERFSALIRTISDSSTFQALAKTAIGIANAFLSVSESLTPIIPILTKLAAFKLAKGASSFFQGFFGSVGAGGGAGGVGGNLGRVATGQPKGGGGGGAASGLAGSMKAMNTALGLLNKSTGLNTTALKNLTTAIGRLETKIGNINFGGGPRRGGARGTPGARTRGFATGGLVPGQGNRDTVPAMLTPGEFVIKKSSVNSIGAGNLAGMNGYAEGGTVKSGRRFYGKKRRTQQQIDDQAAVNALMANAGGGGAAGAQAGPPSGPLKLRTSLPRLGVIGLSGSSTSKTGLVGSKKTISPKTYNEAQAKALGIGSTIPGRSQIQRMGPEDTLKTEFKIAVSKVDGEAGPQFDKIVDDAMAVVIDDAAREIAANLSVAGTIKVPQLSAIQGIAKALDVGDVGGKVFEGVVGALTGATLGDKNARFDIGNPTKAQIDKLNAFVSPNISKLANLLEIKKTISTGTITDKGAGSGSIFDKILGAAKQTLPPDIGFSSKLGLKVVPFAKGGAVGTDTVPAMLTPGEFVVNRKSAQGIGYGNLKKMNTGGKLAGYAAGGIVQHFKKGGGVKGEGGGGLSNAAFIIPDLLFTLPMLTESFKQLNEGVEGAGAQFTSTLLSLGTSLLFIIPNLKGFGKNLRFGGGAREAFGKGFKRNKAQGGGFFDGIGRGLRGAAKGGSKKAGFAKLSVAGTGLTAAALGPAIAGGVGIALAGPISELVSGVQNLETIAGFKGSRTESASQAAERGQTKGAIAGASGGAALGFIIGGPVGAAVAGSLGGLGGAIIGEMEATANKIRFDAVVGLNDASKKASEALLQLAKDTFVTAEDLTKANIETSAFLNNLGTGGEFAQADAESAFGAENLQNIMVGLEATLGKGIPTSFITDFFNSSELEGLSNEDEVNQRVGSRTALNDFIERATGLSAAFGKGEKSKREVQGDIASGKIQRKGTDLFEKLKTFDPKLAEQSSEALANSLTSVTDTFIKASSNSTESIRKLQASLGSIDTTDPQKAVQGLETFIEALEGGALGEAGKAAADTIKNDLALQLAAGTAEAIKGLGEDDAKAVSAQIQDVIAASQSDAPGAFSAALFKMNEELNAGNDNLKGAQRAFSRITKEAAKNTLATSQQATQQSIVNNLLEASNRFIDGLILSLQKLTGAMQQTSNTFDIFVSNTEKRIASLLSGQADFALDEVVNPFENLDLQGLEGGGSNAAIENAFKEIASVGGTGATETLKGLQAAPGFAQALPDILKDSVNEISDESKKKGGKLLTNAEMLKIIEDRAVASDPNLKGPLLDSFLKEMEKTLTQARQGEGGGIESVRAALGESGEVVEKFSGVVKEVIAETSEQFKISQEIAQRASDIAKVQRDVQKKYREFDIKRTEIDNRVGEITGERKGSLEQAQGDLNTQIARQTGQAVSIGGAVVAGGVATGNVAALQARQTALQTKKSQIEAARAVGGNSTNEVLISQLATVKSALEDTTGALNTLADDTTRLAAIESEIATLQSRQLAEQDALKGTFERLQGIQDKLNSGDFKGAAQDRKILRGEFGAVQKLETGQQLTTGEMLKLLNGTLDPILTAGGKTQEEIAKLKTQASGAARDATIDGLRQLGIIFQGFQGVDQGAAIDAKKDQARQIGAQQKAALDAMEQRVRTQTITEMNMLNTAVNELRIQMQLASFSAAELRKVDDVQKKDVEDFLGGAGQDIFKGAGPKQTATIAGGLGADLTNIGAQQTVQFGGFTPANADGDLSKAGVRQIVQNQLAAEIEDLRILKAKVSDGGESAAIQKEITRLTKAADDLGNIEAKAVEARDIQFKADQQAAREAAKEAIKLREAELRRDGRGPAQGGVVAPVFTGTRPLVPPSVTGVPPGMNVPAIVQQLKGGGPNVGPTNLARGMGGFSNIEDRLSLGDKGRGGGDLGVEIDKLSKSLVLLSSVDPDLLTVLGQISESSKTTADILTAEQGVNSFNVYDKTGDKNAGESSKKLSAISTSSKLTATEQRPEKPLSKKSTGELTDADIKQIIANQETNRLIAEARNGKSRVELSRDMQAPRPSDSFSVNAQRGLARQNQQRQQAAELLPNLQEVVEKPKRQTAMMKAYQNAIDTGRFPSENTDLRLEKRGMDAGGMGTNYLSGGPTREEQFALARDQVSGTMLGDNAGMEGVLDLFGVMANVSKEIYKTVKSGGAGVGYQLGMNPDFEGLYNTPLFGGEGRGVTGSMGSGGGGWQQFFNPQAGGLADIDTADRGLEQMGEVEQFFAENLDIVFGLSKLFSLPAKLGTIAKVGKSGLIESTELAARNQALQPNLLDKALELFKSTNNKKGGQSLVEKVLQGPQKFDEFGAPIAKVHDPQGLLKKSDEVSPPGVKPVIDLNKTNLQGVPHKQPKPQQFLEGTPQKPIADELPIFPGQNRFRQPLPTADNLRASQTTGIKGFVKRAQADVDAVGKSSGNVNTLNNLPSGRGSAGNLNSEFRLGDAGTDVVPIQQRPPLRMDVGQMPVTKTRAQMTPGEQMIADGGGTIDPSLLGAVDNAATTGAKQADILKAGSAGEPFVKQADEVADAATVARQQKRNVPTENESLLEFQRRGGTPEEYTYAKAQRDLDPANISPTDEAIYGSAADGSVNIDSPPARRTTPEIEVPKVEVPKVEAPKVEAPVKPKPAETAAARERAAFDNQTKQMNTADRSITGAEAITLTTAVNTLFAGGIVAARATGPDAAGEEGGAPAVPRAGAGGGALADLPVPRVQNPRIAGDGAFAFNPQAGALTEDEKKRGDILRKEQGEASKKLAEQKAKDEQKQSMDNLFRVSSPVAEPTPQPYTGPTAYEMALAAEQRAKAAADKAAADKVAANAAAVAGIDRGMGGGTSLISDKDRKDIPGSPGANTARFQGLAPASAGFSTAPTPRAKTMPDSLNIMAEIPAEVQAADKTRATRDQIQGVSSGNAERLAVQKKKQEELFARQKKEGAAYIARMKEISQFGMTEEEIKRKDFFDTRQQAGSPYFDQQKDEDFKAEARARGYDPEATPIPRNRGIDSGGNVVGPDRNATLQEQRDLEFKKIQARARLVTPEAFDQKPVTQADVRASEDKLKVAQEARLKNQRALGLTETLDFPDADKIKRDSEFTGDPKKAPMPQTLLGATGKDGAGKDTRSNEQRVVDDLNKQRKLRGEKGNLTISDLRKKSFFTNEGLGLTKGQETKGSAMGIQGDRMSKLNVTAAIEAKRQAAIKDKEAKDKRDYDARVAYAKADSGEKNAAGYDMTNAELARKRYADRQARKKDALRQVRSGNLKPKDVQDFMNNKGGDVEKGVRDAQAKKDQADDERKFRKSDGSEVRYSDLPVQAQRSIDQGKAKLQ